MVSYFKRNIQGLDPINEKARLLPPPPLMRLRHQGTDISFNLNMFIGRHGNVSSELDRRSGSDLQVRGPRVNQNVEASVSNKFGL
jgi:hypothetical protein